MTYRVSRETQHERVSKRKPRKQSVEAIPGQDGCRTLAVSESGAKLAAQVEKDIMTTSQMADIETFCDVVSDILDRLIKENLASKNERSKPVES